MQSKLSNRVILHCKYLIFVFPQQFIVSSFDKILHELHQNSATTWWLYLICAVLLDRQARFYVRTKKQAQKIPLEVPHSRNHLHTLLYSSGVIGLFPSRKRSLTSSLSSSSSPLFSASSSDKPSSSPVVSPSSSCQ